MSTQRTLPVLALLALATLVACETDDERVVTAPPTDEAISLIRTPAALDARAIDPDQLSLEVVVDSRVFLGEPAGAGVWRVRFPVPPNRTVDVELTFFERVRDRTLPLVRTSLSITVAESDTVVGVPASRFDGSSFDFDADGVSNIDERRAASDPTDPSVTPFDTDPGGDTSTDEGGETDAEGSGGADAGGSDDGRDDTDAGGSDGGDGGGGDDGGGDDGGGTEPADRDGDGRVDALDNCPSRANADQSDLDGDGEGDVCDDDRDGDGVPDDRDNCPSNADPNQSDRDGDGLGDICDPEPDPEPEFDDSFFGEVRLDLARSRLGGPRDVFASGQDSFDVTLRPDGSGFGDFFFLTALDPDDANRLTYVELAISDTEASGDGALRVTLRHLMFVELRDTFDDAGEEVRIAESRRTTEVTLRPGETRELDPGTAGSEALRALLAPSVSTPEAVWRADISVRLTFGR